MLCYVLKKGFVFVLSLWCTITAAFLLMHALPGDPFIGDHPVPGEVLRSLHAYYGLDEPLWRQYFLYLKRLLRLDLGVSMIYPGKRVSQLIAEGIGPSLLLGGEALLLAVPAGILLGVRGALKEAPRRDVAMVAFCALAASLPSFLLGAFLQQLFCVKLHWLPIASWGSWAHTILPAASLAALPAAYIAKLTKARMEEILEQDYILVAKAKGLSMSWIAYKHALRGALLPAIAYLGPAIAHIAMGSFMIEKIFSIPGLGKWMISSISARDYPMILGLTLFFSFFLMLSSFIVDMIYGWMDPRIRNYAKSS